MDTSSLCQGCLAPDRSLRPLAGYRNTFDMIVTRNICKNRNFKSSRLKADLYFCWECIKLLKNVRNFQEKVLKAQEFIEVYLKTRTDGALGPLTKLTTNLITEANLTINFEDKNIFEEQEAEKIKLKIKEELQIDIENENMNICVENVEQNNTNVITKELDKKSQKDINTDFSCDDDIKYDVVDSFEDFTNNFPIDIELKKEPGIELLLEPEFIPEDAKEIVFVQTKIVKKKRKGAKMKIEKVKRKRKLGKNKTIENENYLCRSDWKEKYDNLCKLISIDEEEMMNLRESIRNSDVYVNSKIKCESCIQGFTLVKDYDVHVKTKHDKNSDYHCDICSQTFKNIGTHKYHRARHFRKLQCNICGNMYHDTYSFRRHLGKDHNKGHVCHICGEDCKDWSSFLLHRKKEHRDNKFICNDCDASFPTKREIEYHCRKHMTYFCRPCQSKFKNYMTYIYHKRSKHANGADENIFKVKEFKPELAYCVECDIQYESEGLLKKHLRNSYRHNPPANKIFTCPQCPKTYKKACTRNYHYNKAHVGITKFFCEICQKYYLNNFQLRRHKTRIHDMVPAPKDKLCAFCGRGFSTNRTLKNHIMTHTGERPHECGCCGAKFSQKYAMKTHMKNVHRIMF